MSFATIGASDASDEIMYLTIPQADDFPTWRCLMVPDVARFYDCAPDKIRQWAQKGKLPGFRLGRDWRFLDYQIAAWPRPAPERRGRPPREGSIVRSALYYARDRRRSRKRYAAIKCATPAWADKSAIALVYAEARAKTRAAGIAFHVDHIIPLHGPLACGLHVEANLRVILGRDNVRRPRTWTQE